MELIFHSHENKTHFHKKASWAPGLILKERVVGTRKGDLLYFTVDTEPPTFSQCPGDIVREEGNFQASVSWAEPVFADNSGQIVAVASNRQNGSIFTVPGVYYVEYIALDGSNNENKNCTFKITLKSKLLSNENIFINY